MPDAVFFHIIDGELAASGMLGGLFHAYINEKAGVREVVRYLVLGGLAANFLTPGILVIGGSAVNFFAPKVFEILILLPPFTLAFLVGMFGRPIGYLLEIAFRKWIRKEKEND